MQDKVYVDSLIVSCDGTVIVFLSDKSQFKYVEKARVWREITSAFEGEDHVSDSYPVTTLGGQNILKVVETKTGKHRRFTEWTDLKVGTQKSKFK